MTPNFFYAIVDRLISFDKNGPGTVHGKMGGDKSVVAGRRSLLAAALFLMLAFMGSL